MNPTTTTTTKDRIIELRGKQKFGADEDEGKGKKGNKDKEKADPLEAFWADCEDIGGEIEHLSQIVNDLTAKHQAPSTDKEWQIVEERLDEVKRLANRIRGKLKRMDMQLKQNTDEESTEYRIMRTQHLTLSRGFIDVMKAFNERQQAYREFATARIKKELGDRISQSALDHLLEGQAGAHVQLQQVAKKQHLNKTHLHEVEARHRDIKRLENNIRELHDMWMDMALIVEKQGDMVDRIEFNVAQARDYTEGGAENIRKALENYRAARRKKCICKAILISLAVIIVLSIILGILKALAII